jgi:hypothetical protein
MLRAFRILVAVLLKAAVPAQAAVPIVARPSTETSRKVVNGTLQSSITMKFPLGTRAVIAVKPLNWFVSSGQSLQAALDEALPGDTITLQAGATFTGNVTLPEKSGTGWITWYLKATREGPSTLALTFQRRSDGRNRALDAILPGLDTPPFTFMVYSQADAPFKGESFELDPFEHKQRKLQATYIVRATPEISPARRYVVAPIFHTIEQTSTYSSSVDAGPEPVCEPTAAPVPLRL